MLDEINRQAEINRVEQDVKDAEYAYVATVKASECKQYDAPGKIIREIEHDYNSVLIVFTDGTYIYYEAEHDYDGTQLTATTPDRQACEKYGIGSPVDRANLERARQCLAAVRRKDEYMSTMAKLVRDIGKENILKLLKETP